MKLGSAVAISIPLAVAEYKYDDYFLYEMYFI